MIILSYKNDLRPLIATRNRIFSEAEAKGLDPVQYWNNWYDTPGARLYYENVMTGETTTDASRYNQDWIAVHIKYYDETQVRILKYAYDLTYGTFKQNIVTTVPDNTPRENLSPARIIENPILITPAEYNYQQNALGGNIPPYVFAKTEFNKPQEIIIPEEIPEFYGGTQATTTPIPGGNDKYFPDTFYYAPQPVSQDKEMIKVIDGSELSEPLTEEEKAEEIEKIAKQNYINANKIDANGAALLQSIFNPFNSTDLSEINYDEQYKPKASSLLNFYYTTINTDKIIDYVVHNFSDFINSTPEEASIKINDYLYPNGYDTFIPKYLITDYYVPIYKEKPKLMEVPDMIDPVENYPIDYFIPIEMYEEEYIEPIESYPQPFEQIPVTIPDGGDMALPLAPPEIEDEYPINVDWVYPESGNGSYPQPIEQTPGTAPPVTEPVGPGTAAVKIKPIYLIAGLLGLLLLSEK